MGGVFVPHHGVSDERDLDKQQCHHMASNCFLLFQVPAPLKLHAKTHRQNSVGCQLRGCLLSEGTCGDANCCKANVWHAALLFTLQWQNSGSLLLTRAARSGTMLSDL
eukprot:6487092-Amphidinium_carterae.1